MDDLASKFDLGGGEGIDASFEPDTFLEDGDVIEGNDWKLQVIHTPGHLSNHVSFSDGANLFSGDHVMGWATSLVSPPDGDLTQFMASLEKLRNRSEIRYLPGHGAQVDDPQRIVEHLISHRKGRAGDNQPDTGGDTRYPSFHHFKNSLSQIGRRSRPTSAVRAAQGPVKLYARHPNADVALVQPRG